MEKLLQLDGQLLLWIQDNLRFDFLNTPMMLISELAHAGIFWILLALVLLCVKKTRRLGAACAIALILDVILTNGILKHVFHRIRPYEVIEGLKLLCAKEKDFSFPSGHSAASLACAWVLFRRTPKKYGVPALVLALLICWSRLYLGVHYPTDVLAGILVGIIAACCAMPLEKKIPDRLLWLKQ